MAEGSDAAFVDATAQGSDGAFVDADGGQYEDLDAVADADVARNVSSVPLSHRATAVACPTVRRAGTVTAQCLDRGTFSVDPCRSDTDCEAGVNGRCDCMFPEAGYVGCTYDQCVTDTDCDGGVCSCSLAGNTCVPALCRTDSECKDGGYCGLTVVGCGPSVIYSCHQPTDDCANATDCPRGPPATGPYAYCMGPPTPSCGYDPTSSRWVCTTCYASCPDG
jgi:hypothetical protein